MNKTTTMTMCVVMLMIGMAFTAVAAMRSDSSGDTAFSVNACGHFGTYTIMDETFTVVKQLDRNYYGYQFSDTDVIVDVEEIPDLCFAGSNITNLILTSNVKSVGEDAFAALKNLRSVARAGSGELTIAEDAFKGCTSLKYIDLRGASVHEEAFPSGLTSMRAMDIDGDAPYASGAAVRVKDTGGQIEVTMYDGSQIRVCYKGEGLIQLADDSGNRASYSTNNGTNGSITYRFTPFSGKDMTLGYRVIHISYNLDDVPDVDIEFSGPKYFLVDLAEGATSTKWNGWRDATSSQYTLTEFDKSFINNYCSNSKLNLLSVTDAYTISYSIQSPVDGEAVPSLAASQGTGTIKYPSIEDSEHYSFAGWIRVGDDTNTVHRSGEYVRYFGNQTLEAVWEPKAEYTYQLQYTNVDGTGLGEPESYGYGQEATVKAMVPYDETPTQKIDGWRPEGSEDVLREGDTVTILCDTELIPVLKDRDDVTVTFDNDGSEQTMTVKDGYPSAITVEDPKDATRIFIGWTMEGTDWALMNGDDVTATTEITLTPTWRDKQQYSVTYMSEGYQVGDSQTALETDEVRVHADVSKTNHRLTGWSDGADTVDDGSSYRVMGNVTFTAVWTELEKHTVTYHLVDGTTPSFSAYHGSTVRICADPGYRQGYDLLGWSPTGGPIVEYGNGDSVELTADLDLYPVWMRNGSPIEEQDAGDGPDTGDSSSGDGQTTDGDGSEDGGDPTGGSDSEDGAGETDGGTESGDSSGDGQTTEGGDSSTGEDTGETDGDGSADGGDSTVDTGTGDGTGTDPSDDQSDDGNQGQDGSSSGTESGDDSSGTQTQDQTSSGDSEPSGGNQSSGSSPSGGSTIPWRPNYNPGDSSGSGSSGTTENDGDDGEAPEEPDVPGETTDPTDGTDGTVDDDPSDDGGASIDTGTDPGSGSGGSGIPAGTGIAVLAGVSALVAGFMVVMFRRS